MGNDEIVKVKVRRVIGENAVPITMTKGELMRLTPKSILETALAKADVTRVNRDELEIMGRLVNSGIEPKAMVVDRAGNKKLIPYAGKGVEEYLNPDNEVVIAYGTQNVIG